MLGVLLKEWRLLPRAARRYIIYMTLTTPALFVWLLVPYLMLKVGIEVAEAGLILSIASASAAGLNYLVGKYLDYADPVKVMFLIGAIEGIAYLTYYGGFVGRLVALVLVAAVIERLARGFYVVYAVYEYDAYPEDRREKAFMIHNTLPYAAQLITYPLIGLLISSLSIEGQINSLIAFSIASVVLGALALVMIPSLGRKELGISKGSRVSIKSLPKGLIIMTAAILLLGLGTELTPTLALTYLFMNISKNPLLSMALYEALTGVPITIVSILMLRASPTRGYLFVITGMSLIALGDLILGFSNSALIAISVALIESLGYALMDPYLMDTLFANIPKEKRGEVLGAIAGIRRLLCIAGPAIAGLLASIDTHLPFLTSAAVIVGATVLVSKEVKVRIKVKTSSPPP